MTAIHDMTAAEILGRLQDQEAFSRRSHRRRHPAHRGLGAEAEGAVCAGLRGRAQGRQGVREALAGGHAAGRAGRRADHHQGEHRHQGRAGAARHGGDRARRRRGRCAGGGAGARGGRHHPRQDHHAGLRHAVVGPQLLPSADAQSLEPRLEPRRLERRRGCRGGGGLWPACISAPTSAARCACRPAGTASSP